MGEWRLVGWVGYDYGVVQFFFVKCGFDKVVYFVVMFVDQVNYDYVSGGVVGYYVQQGGFVYVGVGEQIYVLVMVDWQQCVDGVDVDVQWLGDWFVCQWVD